MPKSTMMLEQQVEGGCAATAVVLYAASLRLRAWWNMCSLEVLRVPFDAPRKHFNAPASRNSSCTVDHSAFL